MGHPFNNVYNTVCKHYTSDFRMAYILSPLRIAALPTSLFELRRDKPLRNAPVGMTVRKIG